MITVVCDKTRTLWVFTTAPKISPVRMIFFILTMPKNEKYTQTSESLCGTDLKMHKMVNIWNNKNLNKSIPKRVWYFGLKHTAKPM